jgi:hypothetical protein
MLGTGHVRGERLRFAAAARRPGSGVLVPSKTVVGSALIRLRRGDGWVALICAATSVALTGIVFEAVTDRDWSVQGWEWPQVLVAGALVALGAFWLVTRRRSPALVADGSFTRAVDDSAAAGHGVRAPLAAAVCAAASVAIVASVLGYTPWESSTWSRWDSGLYEAIARDGYDLGPCEDEPTKWCGDAAWFPAYPWLVGGLHQFGLPLRGTAVVVSWLFALGTIFLIWVTFLERRVGAAAVAGLFYAAFAPGQIYHYAVFPLSMLAFATVACLWLLHRGRYLGAGLAGAVATLSYPLGVLLVPVSAVWLLAHRSVSLGERLRRTAITSGPMVAGLWIFMIVQRLDTGRWDAFFLIQEKYENLHGSQNPIVATWDLVRGAVENFGGGIAFVVGAQTALVTVVLAAVLVHAIVRRKSLDSADALLLLWAVSTWAVLNQAFSVQRGQAALLPLAVLVARLPARVAWPLALTAAAIAIWLESYFLDGTLI